ncbi:response regulator transcription factor [Cellulosimicrobium cellulans]|uniref:response regulator transcription factor n=1 Tax=Cellulosimicrobium cellulans TaxID=1710 RepID=UPI0016522B5A|nr:response regulator transcription factor [Cellulosimicrobium cellulans]
MPDGAARVLLVEDDVELGAGIELAFGADHYAFDRCTSSFDARQALARSEFDLHVLDVNLPDGTGTDLCRHIRSFSAAPVILLTVRDRETDVVAGFGAGADDYVTKPFSLAILRARVRAALNRGARHQSPAPYRAGPFVLDFAAGHFTRAGRPIALTAGQQRVLQHLVRNENAVVTLRSIAEAAWDEPVSDTVVYATVRRLRARLEDEPTTPRHLVSAYGLGYRWVTTP